MKSRHHTKKGPGRIPFNKGNPVETGESFLWAPRGHGKSTLINELLQAGWTGTMRPSAGVV